MHAPRPLNVSRRRLLQGVGAAALALAAPPLRAGAQQPGVTARLAQYIVAARTRPLPDAVVLTCKHHILDTFAAMVSGSRLRPGVLALKYVQSLGGTPQATVIGADYRTTAINAGLANGMCAHGDETDDFEATTKAHPGCSTVPSAFAAAELAGGSGQDFIRAVTLG